MQSRKPIHAGTLFASMDASCNIVDLISCFSAESHTLHQYDLGFVSFLASFWNDVMISETHAFQKPLCILQHCQSYQLFFAGY
jgi:hypothetical protein